MLKKRIITVLTFSDGVLFRTKLFNPDYRYTLNFVDAWSVDEIVALDVTRPGHGDRSNFFRVVRDFARRCFVPLSVGGGVRSLEDVDALMECGADKIIVNTGALERPALVSEIAEQYGTQCVTLSVDARQTSPGDYEVFSHFGAKPTGRKPEAWAQEAVERGAGEILITSIERDGWLRGYDLELCRNVVDAVDVPVLVLGGCGNWAHMVEGFQKTGAAGCCTQNIYHFTETSIESAKRYLRVRDIDVRL